MSAKSIWLTIGVPEDIPMGRGKPYLIEDMRVAIFHTEDGRFFAIDQNCPHLLGPLAEGLLQGTTVTCLFHNWQFDIITGQCLNRPSHQVNRYAVKVEDGLLWLALN